MFLACARHDLSGIRQAPSVRGRGTDEAENLGGAWRTSGIAIARVWSTHVGYRADQQQRARTVQGRRVFGNGLRLALVRGQNRRSGLRATMCVDFNACEVGCHASSRSRVAPAQAETCDVPGKSTPGCSAVFKDRRTLERADNASRVNYCGGMLFENNVCKLGIPSSQSLGVISARTLLMGLENLLANWRRCRTKVPLIKSILKGLIALL